MEKVDSVSLNKRERRKFYSDLQKEEKRKLALKSKIIKFGTIAIVLAAVGTGGFFLFKELTKPIPNIGEVIPVLGRDHVAPNATHSAYNSNPPTSGPHYGGSAPWGVYDKELADEELIHNLEHGGVWISYKPELDKESVEKLKDLVKGYKSKVILTSRSKNDSKIAVTSWGRLLKLEEVDEQKIKDYIEFYRNKGPERVPD